MIVFADIVEEVKQLDYEELIELQSITEKLKIECERQKLYNSHIESMKEYENGELTFTSDFNELKKILRKDD